MHDLSAAQDTGSCCWQNLALVYCLLSCLWVSCLTLLRSPCSLCGLVYWFLPLAKFSACLLSLLDWLLVSSHHYDALHVLSAAQNTGSCCWQTLALVYCHVEHTLTGGRTHGHVYWLDYSVPEDALLQSCTDSNRFDCHEAFTRSTWRSLRLLRLCSKWNLWLAILL